MFLKSIISSIFLTLEVEALLKTTKNSGTQGKYNDMGRFVSKSDFFLLMSFIFFLLYCVCVGLRR